uniref:Uncharacterized protein n=1 Tax=Ixodes ricinus TaxID=34613 RepID=A0A6B0UE89_IXORI
MRNVLFSLTAGSTALPMRCVLPVGFTGNVCSGLKSQSLPKPLFPVVVRAKCTQELRQPEVVVSGQAYNFRKPKLPRLVAEDTVCFAKSEKNVWIWPIT